MSSETFEAITTPERTGDARFVLRVPDGYQQGRGAYGGLVLAAIVRAVEAAHGGPDRALRTLTAELCAPVLVGEAEIRLEELRLGSGTSTIAARVLQEGVVAAHAVLVLGRDRSAEPEALGMPRPEIPDWTALQPVPDGMLPPRFAAHFEFRPHLGIPFSGAGEPLSAGFIRPRNPGPARDAAYVAALADAWWPAIFPTLRAPRPMATITFTLDLVASAEGLDPDVPYYHHAKTLVSRAGFVPELRTLWGHDGRLLAINHQTFVTLG